MWRALLVAAVFLTTACKDAAGATGPAVDGTLNVQIETKTCSAEGSFDIEVFIDHVHVGTPTFSVGSNASYTVTAGSHSIGGLSTNGKFSWGSEDVIVPAGGQYTSFFACM
jgi:hypothetical protein